VAPPSKLHTQQVTLYTLYNNIIIIIINVAAVIVLIIN